MHEINSGAVEKIVLSRLKPAKTDRNPLEIFDVINQTYLNTFNYIISNQQIGTWIGASPELLLDLSNNHLSTVSLAGTRPANGFVAWTAKERKEQQYVTDFIVETLQKNECSNISKNGPATLTAGPVQHLKTEISATCSNTATLDKILADLHPTPATCGIPKSAAKEKIINIEAHHRKFYTGYIGLIAENKKTFFVNLRCMEIQQKRALLYVGGGITAESEAEKEWDETERKAVTLLSVLH
jgi:isochorismate synthase